MSAPTSPVGAPPRIAYTVKEVAEALGVPPKQVYGLVARDEIRHRRIGRHIVIPVAALNELLAD